MKQKFGINSAPSDPVVIGDCDVVPVPPEVESISGSVVTGTTSPNTYVKLTVSGATGYPRGFGPVFSADGMWSLDIGTTSFAPVTTLLATANYPGGELSDTYVKQPARTPQYDAPAITEVGANQVSGTAPATGQQIMGWRSSDGKKIVDLMMNGTSLSFEAPYLDGEILEEGDILNLVSCYPVQSSMTPYTKRARRL
ncbi:hypothetical protein K7H91_21415 [Martelella mediterranea]|uniref:hypothetical protein n=1 Tax=Martelella mediterranea TaxID=293089 RepID=UPI001E41636B|nr:hypothetical protein [Martelella mediterranea]MCD1636325.1 hypothetical protein [Martelella mediterranea]